MKKSLLAMAAACAVSMGAPAASQGAGANFQVRVQQLRATLQAGIRSGTITQTEAAPLRERLRELTELEREFRPGGYTTGEREALQQRIQILRPQIRAAMRTHVSNGNCPPDLIFRNNLCVRPAVGQRYTAHFRAVPARYGTRYRDTGRYYYRFDNVDRVYQVDRRTGRITRVSRVPRA